MFAFVVSDLAQPSCSYMASWFLQNVGPQMPELGVRSMCSGVCQETNCPLHPPQKQILSEQIINFGADSIKGGSWCVGGFRTQYGGSLTRLA